MKKMLILLAVATITATAPGCCCTRLCSCNWFGRGAYCGPATPTYAPLVASPCAPYAQAAAPALMPQYMPMAAPMAAPMMAAPATCGCAPACTSWDPCQCAVVTQAQPQAMPACYAEPSCGYVEAGCGSPYTDAVSFGPSMPMDCGGCSTGGVMSAPAPEAFVAPTPAAE